VNKGACAAVEMEAIKSNVNSIPWTRRTGSLDAQHALLVKIRPLPACRRPAWAILAHLLGVFVPTVQVRIPPLSAHLFSKFFCHIASLSCAVCFLLHSQLVFCRRYHRVPLDRCAIPTGSCTACDCIDRIQPRGGGLADVVRGRQSIRAVQLSRREQGKWCFGRVPRGGAGLRRRGSRHRCRARWVNVNAGSQRVSGDTASLAVLAPDEEASEAQQRKEEHYPNHRAGHGTYITRWGGSWWRRRWRR